MYQETCTYTQTRLYEYHMAVYQCQKGEMFLHLKLPLKRDVPLVGSGFLNKEALQFKYLWKTLIMYLCPLLSSCVSEREPYSRLERKSYLLQSCSAAFPGVPPLPSALPAWYEDRGGGINWGKISFTAFLSV